jgi:hypothetical protein
MYAVDRRIYTGDKARPMYNAAVFGMQLYYVPADLCRPPTSVDGSSSDTSRSATLK